MSTHAAPSLVHRGRAEAPPSGLTYALTLRPQPTVQGVFGFLLAFSGFILIVPLISELIIRLGFLARGGDWASYRKAARAYELPEGLLAGHLALASLTLMVLLINRWVHGRAARWTWSVQPGFRWRYWLATLLVALVVLNGFLWLSFLWEGRPTFSSGQDSAVWFLTVVLLTSPLQALAEEVFFRGYLLQSLGSLTGRAWIGVVGSSVVFALMHGTQNPALFAHRLAFGLVAGSLVVMTGGLEAGIAAHIVNNLGAFGYAIFTTSVAEVRAVQEITWAKAGWDILTFLAFALVASWIGKRMRVARTTP